MISNGSFHLPAMINDPTMKHSSQRIKPAISLLRGHQKVQKNLAHKLHNMLRGIRRVKVDKTMNEISQKLMSQPYRIPIHKKFQHFS